MVEKKTTPRQLLDMCLKGKKERANELTALDIEFDGRKKLGRLRRRRRWWSAHVVDFRLDLTFDVPRGMRVFRLAGEVFGVQFLGVVIEQIAHLTDTFPFPSFTARYPYSTVTRLNGFCWSHLLIVLPRNTPLFLGLWLR